jgi:hypothetical protein
MAIHDHDLDDFADRNPYDEEQSPHRDSLEDPDVPDILDCDIDAPETTPLLLAAAVLLVAVLVGVAVAGSVL